VVALALALPFLVAAQPPSATGQQLYTIAGRIVDAESGIPLSAAEVAIAPVGHRDRLTNFFTSADGVFSFSGLTKGKYVLQAARRGYAAESYQEHQGYSTAVAAGPGLDSAHISFPLERPGAIFGKVTDQDGEPVPNARLSVFEQQVRDGRRGVWFTSITGTSNDGTYKVSKLRPGNYYIGVSARPWYAHTPDQGTRENSASADAALDVAYPITFYPEAQSVQEAAPIHVQSGSRVQADLVLNTVPAAHVQLRTPSEGRIVRAHLEFVTDWAGNLDEGFGWWGDGMQMNSIAPGTYRLIAVWEDVSGRHTTRRIVSIPGDLTLDVESGDELVLTANVTSADNAGRGFPPIALRNVRTGVVVRGRPDAKGRMDWRGIELVPDRYELVTDSESESYVKSVAVAGAKARGVTIDLPSSGTVEMKITLAGGLAQMDGTVTHDGSPVGGSLVLLLPEDLTSNASLIRRDQSDSDGTFALRNIVPGRYTLLTLPAGMDDIEYAMPNVIGPYLSAGQRLEIQPSGKYQVNAKLAPVAGAAGEHATPTNPTGASAR
jgi:hypothetical protein